MRHVDIEDIGRKIDEHLKREFPKPTEQDIIAFKPILEKILASDSPLDATQLKAIFKKYKFHQKRSFLFQIYLILLKRNEISHGVHEDTLRKSLQIKPCKSWSGINSVTVFTAPYPEYTNDKGERVKQSFTCESRCAYCPNEPGQPRSYIKGEPGVLRANKNGFDAVKQMWDRMNTLYLIGSPPTKCEIIISGGTWTSYPLAYRYEFIRDIYYAANVFWQHQEDNTTHRNKLSLEQEKYINQNAQSRIVGLTIETRPDTINPQEIRHLRRMGVTRVQLGIQHIHDGILEVVKRDCPSHVTIAAIELLKRNCYKIDAHWMPNLPGASLEHDTHMFMDVLVATDTPIPKRYTQIIGNIPVYIEEWQMSAPQWQLDQWKIYPTAVTPWTDIETWFKQGTYVQYSEKDMFDMLYQVLSVIPPFIRVNRVIRDIPEMYIYNENTGSDNTNMRQELHDELYKSGVHCMDIRNREVKNAIWDGQYVVCARKYNASNGIEHFISAESKNAKTLYGFIRLRFDNAINKIFYELQYCALIRELHVYGDVSKIGKGGHIGKVQHNGIGTTLLYIAESMAKKAGYKAIAVISAEGTKPYYRDKLGYEEKDNFMIKKL